MYEEDPQLLARHMLLIYALLDGTLPPHERVEAFLELHGSALLRRCTADWLGACGPGSNWVGWVSACPA